MLLLERAYLPDESATFGRLTLRDGSRIYTLEPPWRGNEVKNSCIPEGVYALQLRESPQVRRASGGEYTEGWEVADVQGRSFIMFHPGNWVRDTEGCILTGTGFSWEASAGPMVTSSRIAFRALMNALTVSDFWDIKIVNMNPEYP